MRRDDKKADDGASAEEQTDSGQTQARLHDGPPIQPQPPAFAPEGETQPGVPPPVPRDDEEEAAEAPTVLVTEELSSDEVHAIDPTEDDEDEPVTERAPISLDDIEAPDGTAKAFDPDAVPDLPAFEIGRALDELSLPRPVSAADDDKRSSSKFPVRVGPAYGQPYATVRAFDLSTEMIMIASSRSADVGATFSVEIELDGDDNLYIPEVEVTANVEATADRPAGFTARFTDLTVDVADALEAFIASLPDSEDDDAVTELSEPDVPIVVLRITRTDDESFEGEEIQRFDGETIRIGVGDRCELTLPRIDEAAILAVHAVILNTEAEGLVLRNQDTAGRVGVTVNTDQQAMSEDIELKSGDILDIGPYRIEVGNVVMRKQPEDPVAVRRVFYVDEPEEEPVQAFHREEEDSGRTRVKAKRNKVLDHKPDRRPLILAVLAGVVFLLLLLVVWGQPLGTKVEPIVPPPPVAAAPEPVPPPAPAKPTPEPEPVEELARINVNSTPSNVAVLIGGRIVGRTPFGFSRDLEGQPSILLTMTFRMEGYSDKVVTKQVGPGVNTISAALEKVAPPPAPEPVALPELKPPPQPKPKPKPVVKKPKPRKKRSKPKARPKPKTKPSPSVAEPAGKPNYAAMVRKCLARGTKLSRKSCCRKITSASHRANCIDQAGKK